MQKRISLTKTLHVYQSRTIIRSVMGLVTLLAGLANMLSAIVPRLNWDTLLGEWPLDVQHGTHKLIVVVGFFLVMLSYGLMRGKYQAWCTTVILLQLSALLYLLSGGPVLATILIAALIALLVVFSRSFRARSDPPSVRRGYIALLAGLSVITLYTIGGLLVLYDQFEPLIDRFGIEEVILRLFTNSHLHLPPGTQAFFFGRALPVLCLSAVVFGIVQVLRPVAAALLADEQQRQAASALTRTYGKNSISYFALEAGKSYFFSASGKSVISYVLEGNVAVVAGDPIGPEEEMLPVIQQFVAFCQEQDWKIVFWQVRDTLVDLYRSAGLHLLKIGEDAIISTHTFTCAGKAMANVRSSAKRAEKEGVQIVFSHGHIQDAYQLAQMEQISRTWLANKGGSEMGFSMGRFDPHGDEVQFYALAVDDTNKVHAFVTFIPIYGRNGWGLDLMRRAEQAAPGTMELLLARSIDYLKSRGADIVSLGLAPLSNINAINETSGSRSDVTTSINQVSTKSALYSLTNLFGNPGKNSSLFNFKKKFQPRWESRYLVYSNVLTLPKVGWALYQAHHHDTSLLRILSRSFTQWQAKQQAARRKIADLRAAAGHSPTGGLAV